jgi:hypothetical protein
MRGRNPISLTITLELIASELDKSELVIVKLVIAVS